MADIEKKNVEVGAWWAEGAKKEYVPVTPKFKENKKDDIVDINREEEYRKTQGDAGKKIERHVDRNQGWWRNQQSEERAKDNPEKKDRIPAWANIPEALKEPQKGVGKFFQNVSKRILWPNNI